MRVRQPVHDRSTIVLRPFYDRFSLATSLANEDLSLSLSLSCARGNNLSFHLSFFDEQSFVFFLIPKKPKARSLVVRYFSRFSFLFVYERGTGWGAFEIHRRFFWILLQLGLLGSS